MAISEQWLWVIQRPSAGGHFWLTHSFFFCIQIDVSSYFFLKCESPELIIFCWVLKWESWVTFLMSIVCTKHRSAAAIQAAAGLRSQPGTRGFSYPSHRVTGYLCSNLNCSHWWCFNMHPISSELFTNHGFFFFLYIYPGESDSCIDRILIYSLWDCWTDYLITETMGSRTSVLLLNRHGQEPLWYMLWARITKSTLPLSLCC